MKKTILFMLAIIMGALMIQTKGEDMQRKEKKVIIICAHPDDAEITSGGTSILLSRLGYKIKLVSLTNGNKGHHEGTKNEIAVRRYKEVQEVKSRLNCEYEIINNDDGELEPSLKNRMEVIRLIREWNPDIVITHPPYDYHPDHRYTSLLVQDASFLINVPKVLSEVPALRKSPLFLYTKGRYVNPLKPQPDIVIDITSVAREKAYLIDAHVSQIYEFLPWVNQRDDIIPETQEAKIDYILNNYVLKRGAIRETDREVVIKWYGEKSNKVKTIETYEICEFGRSVTDDDIRELLPMLKQ